MWQLVAETGEICQTPYIILIQKKGSIIKEIHILSIRNFVKKLRIHQQRITLFVVKCTFKTDTFKDSKIIFYPLKDTVDSINFWSMLLQDI